MLLRKIFENRNAMSYQCIVIYIKVIATVDNVNYSNDFHIYNNKLLWHGIVSLKYDPPLIRFIRHSLQT